MSAKYFGQPLFSYRDFFSTKRNTRNNLKKSSGFDFGLIPPTASNLSVNFRPPQTRGFFPQNPRSETRDSLNEPPIASYSQPLPANTPAFFDTVNFGSLSNPEAGDTDSSPRQCLNIPINDGPDEVIEIPLDALAPCDGHGIYDPLTGDCDTDGIGPNDRCGGSPPCCQNHALTVTKIFTVSNRIRIDANYPGGVTNPILSGIPANPSDISFYDPNDPSQLIGGNTNPTFIIASYQQILAAVLSELEPDYSPNSQTYILDGIMRNSNNCPTTGQNRIYDEWCTSGRPPIGFQIHDVLDGSFNGAIRRSSGILVKITRQWYPCLHRRCNRESDTETCVGTYAGNANINATIVSDSYLIYYWYSRVVIRTSISKLKNPGFLAANPEGTFTDIAIDPMCETTPL